MICRTVMGERIFQRKIDGMLSMSRLITSGNAWREYCELKPFSFKQWQALKPTKDLFTKIKEMGERPKLIERKVVGAVDIWVHPEVFINVAMEIYPEIDLFENDNAWMLTYLTSHESFDEYTHMVGVLYVKYPNKTTFQAFLKETNTTIRGRVGIVEFGYVNKGQADTFKRLCGEVSCLALKMVDCRKAVALAMQIDERRTGKTTGAW